MTREPPTVRVRVLVNLVDHSLWVTQTVRTLGQIPGVRLQVQDAKSGVGYDKSNYDITLMLDASGLALHPQAQDDAPYWAIVDAQGRALCAQTPLLQAICSGAGIALQLLQRTSPHDAWRVGRKLHSACSTRYAKGINTLAIAIQRLVAQSVVDWRLSIETDTSHRENISPATSVQWVAWHQVRGAVCAAAVRQKQQFLSEFWRIGVVSVPIESLLDNRPLPPAHWITPSRLAGYWADPCAVPGDSGRLACEYFDERTGTGRLELLHLGGDMQVQRRTPIALSTHQHVSFPNMVEINGRRLALAETAASRECVLYEWNAQGHWNKLVTLLHDVAAVDPALFYWENRWWLAYTNADMGAQDNLCLHYADQLEGSWLPHANNPVKVDVSSARMAGCFFVHEGALYRPGQDCLRTYGAAVVVHRVLQMTPTQFEEEPVRRLEPDPVGGCPDGLHTLNRWGDHILIDGKCLKVNPLALWRKLKARLFHKRPLRALPADSTSARVVVYLPHMRLGGGEISMLRLAQGFAQAGLAVDLVVHSQATCELPNPAEVRLINLECSGTLSAIWRLADFLRECQPRWILSAFPHTNIAAVVAVALSGAPTRCVLSEHAPLSWQIAQQNNWRYRVLPPLVRWAYRRAAAVVAVSKGVRDDLHQLTQRQCAVHVIHNPVLAPNFETEMLQTPSEAWLNDPNLQVVLSVCRLSEEKDLVTVLNAFAQVHDQRPHARLILAGEGPERPHLEERVRQLGLSQWVRLPGRTSQPLAWMRQARVFVLASRFEGFGNVLIEALACGTPVVSTDCPVGPRELLQDGRWGTLVPVGDACAMSHALLAAIDLPQQPPGACEAARQYTQTNACWSYMQLFDSL